MKIKLEDKEKKIIIKRKNYCPEKDFLTQKFIKMNHLKKKKVQIT